MSRRFTGPLATVAVAGMVAAFAGPAAAVVPTPGANGRIAFASSIDGDYDIYTMNPDGSDLQNLTGDFDDHSAGIDCCDDTSPAWSPDGTKIAFTSGRASLYGWNNEIFVMNADGSDQTRLTFTEDFEDDFGPTWSPDGTRLAFTSTRADAGEEDWEVWLMNADGSNQANITGPNQSLAYDDYTPNWSPDGTRIVFTGVRDGAQEILSVAPDGTDEINLTGDDQPTHHHINDFASYRPDGTKLVFMRQINDGGNDWDLVVMNPDGTDMVEVLGDDEWQDVFPLWSPDGNQILFAGNRGDNLGNDVYAIDYPPAATARVAGVPESEVRQITDVGQTAGADWQPVMGDAVVRTTARLRGAAVVPGPGDPDGLGRATIVVSNGRLCARIEVTGIQLPARRTWLVQGGPGEQGRRMLRLPSPGRDGQARGCLTDVSTMLLNHFAAHPVLYSVSVHTRAYPEGAVRGQLG